MSSSNIRACCRVDRMPHIHYASRTSHSVKQAILCTSKKHQEPFGEIDFNHPDRPRYLPTRRHSVKVCSKLQKHRRKSSPPSSSSNGRGDVFCRIPVEELDQQGVFAVRDVIVAERPIYEFVPTDTDTTFTRGSHRSKKSLQKKRHIPPSKRVATSSKPRAKSALDDWSTFLDVLLPSLCVSDQLDAALDSSSCSRASSRRKKLNSKSSKSSVHSRSGRSSVGACFSSHVALRLSSDVVRSNSVNEYRHQPPSTPTRQLHGSVSVAPVVYPIARYPFHLNNMYLVEQRRLSLREHLTFRPVPAE